MYQNLFNAFRKIEFNPTDDEKSVSFFYNEGRKKYWIELYLIPNENGKEKNVCIDFGKVGRKKLVTKDTETLNSKSLSEEMGEFLETNLKLLVSYYLTLIGVTELQYYFMYYEYVKNDDLRVLEKVFYVDRSHMDVSPFIPLTPRQ